MAVRCFACRVMVLFTAAVVNGIGWEDAYFLWLGLWIYLPLRCSHVLTQVGGGGEEEAVSSKLYCLERRNVTLAT